MQHFHKLPLLFTLLLCFACGKSGGGGQGHSEMDSAAVTMGRVAMEEIGYDLPVPAPALHFDVQLEFENFTQVQESKILDAAELIKQVVASEEFKQAVLNHRWQGKKQFANNNGLSNRAIYKRILEASEGLNRGIDNTMNLQVVGYHAQNQVVGYTYPNVLTVWMNKKFLIGRQPHEVTVNMMHEWLHKLGFGHAFKATPERPYSVPYAVGYMMGRIAKKFS
jgi:hypothetical protein